jgi:predicted metal-dependent peptidase
MNEKTRTLARKIIAHVVEELKKKLKVQIEPAITGAIRRDKHSPGRDYRNLDLKRTVRRNLQHFGAASGKLLVDRLYFQVAEWQSRPWHVIVAVDQSGSMLDSAIDSAIMASIFVELPAVRTSLFLMPSKRVRPLAKVADIGDEHRFLTY